MIEVIYGLYHPVTGELRYIGQTYRTLGWSHRQIAAVLAVTKTTVRNRLLEQEAT